MKKNFVTVVLLCLFVISSQLFSAESKTIYLNAIVWDDVQDCIYQINSKDANTWIHLDLKDHSIKLVTTDKTKDDIYYKYTVDGNNWSDIIRISFNSDTGKWEYYQEKVNEIAIESDTVVATNNTITTKDNYNLTNLSVGGLYVTPFSNISDNLYEYSYGATLRIDNINNNLEIFNEFSYWYGNSTNNLLDNIHTALVGIGLGYQVDMGLLSVTPEIVGGVLVEVPIHRSIWSNSYG